MAGCQTPNPQCSAYERGSQAIVFSAQTAAVTQSGQAAPAGSKVYGIVPSVGREQQPYNVAVQVDVSGGTLGTTTTIELLGSLDGVNFYVIQRFTVGAGPTGITASGGMGELVQAVARYLSVSMNTYAAASGTPAVTASITL